MKSFCVIGLGKFGQSLAVSLAGRGYQVMVIDENEHIVNALADHMTNAVIGDPANEQILRASGAAEYDCVVISLTNRINDSILITMLLKEMGSPYVVVRASSDLEKRVLEKIGADRIVFPEQEMGEKLAGMLESNSILEKLQFSDRYSLIETPVPDSWVGKTLLGLSARAKYGVNVIALTKENGEFTINVDPNRPLCAGEKLTLVGENKKISKLLNKNL